MVLYQRVEGTSPSVTFTYVFSSSCASLQMLTFTVISKGNKKKFMGQISTQICDVVIP